MFTISDLSEIYGYNYSVRQSVINILSSKKFDKKDPFQMVAFIDEFVRSNKWEWDQVTYYNCKRIEFLIQVKLPLHITDKKEIYKWLVNNWEKYYFPLFNNISWN